MPRRKRPEGTRAPNGAGSIYFGAYERCWVGRVTVGVRDDGRPDRRTVKRQTEAEVVRAVRELERERDTGTVRRAGNAWTVEQWLTHWLENIARPSVKYKAQISGTWMNGAVEAATRTSRLTSHGACGPRTAPAPCEDPARHATCAGRGVDRGRDCRGRSRPARVSTTFGNGAIAEDQLNGRSVSRYRRSEAYRAYATAVNHHLIPGLGKHRVNKVEPEHFERLYASIIGAGRKPATAHQVHRTARTAFGEALRRGHIGRNPVELAKPPRVEEDEIEPFEIEEIQRLIRTALGRRNGVRFVLALAIGTRQGETIGLRWPRLNTTTKTLTVARQLQRRTWEHGCRDPHDCGEKYHKTKPCVETCQRHKRRPCPPPCPPDCTSHARWCPQRHGGGLVDADVKSRAGRRGIVLPDQLYALVELHRTAQAQERAHAGDLREDGG